MTDPTLNLRLLREEIESEARAAFRTVPGEDYRAVEVERLCAGGCGFPAMPGQRFCETCRDESDWLLALRHENVLQALRREPDYRTIDREPVYPVSRLKRTALCLLKLAILLAFGAMAFGRWWMGQ